MRLTFTGTGAIVSRRGVGDDPQLSRAQRPRFRQEVERLLLDVEHAPGNCPPPDSLHHRKRAAAELPHMGERAEGFKAGLAEAGVKPMAVHHVNGQGSYGIGLRVAHDAFARTRRSISYSP